MFGRFIERENQIFEVLQQFVAAGLEFVIVGGYAVSAYKHRFSVDADIVLKRSDLGGFVRILEKNGFVKTISKRLGNAYSSEFARYEKTTELPISFDLHIDGMGVRQPSSLRAIVQLDRDKGTALVYGKADGFARQLAGALMKQPGRK
ncbi:hypothetical protein HYV83_05240 [Candidatus Woesearchaeota archaeon]|nr:hypothetical protein [Candidatus Woesearchaeota archaeon]